METLHPEGGESPFLVKDDASIAAVMSLCEDDIQYASCPIESCGEAIPFSELDSHMEMHSAEEGTDEDEEHTSKDVNGEEKPGTTFDTKLAYALRNLNDDESSTETEVADPQADTKAAWKNLLKMPDATLKIKGKIIDSTPVKGSRRRLGVSFPCVSSPGMGLLTYLVL